MNRHYVSSPVLDELMLRLAQGEAARRRDRERIARLADAADLEALWRTITRQRLSVLFGRRLLEAQPVASPAIEERLASAVAAAEVRSQAQDLALTGVLSALRASGIPAVSLKGPRFAAAVYGDVAARTSGDLDVLVARKDLDAAVEIVRRLGWEPPRGLRIDRGLPLLHFAMNHPGGLPMLELHWRVHWYERTFAEDALERSVDGQIRGADELAFLVLFLARDALAGLRLAVDVASYMDLRPELSFDALTPICAEHPELCDALTVGARHAMRIRDLQADVPAISSTRLRYALGLADPLLRLAAKQRFAERGLFDILVSPRGQRLRTVRRQVFPNREQLVAQFEAGSGQAPRFAVAQHPVRTLRRYVLAPFLRRQGTPVRDARVNAIRNLLSTIGLEVDKYR